MLPRPRVPSIDIKMSEAPTSHTRPTEQGDLLPTGGAPARVCVDCRASAPETDTNYTLISSQHGWRLTRDQSPDRPGVMVWRCPECWQRHKQRPK